MKAGMLISVVMWLGVSVWLTGCGSSQGWRVSFGVAPVTQIDDSQELKQESTSTRYAGAK